MMVLRPRTSHGSGAERGAGAGRALWHGLPTVPLALTAGLPEPSRPGWLSGDLRSGAVARSGDRATTAVLRLAPATDRPAAVAHGRVGGIVGPHQDPWRGCPSPAPVVPRERGPGVWA